MSDKKRKAPSAAGGPVAKQQKLIPVKQLEKKEKPSGWLPDLLKQKRKENKEMKFNKKRLRFVSDTQKIKQGSDGVLYWMSRDQRVQGKLRGEKKPVRITWIAFSPVLHASCAFPLCSR